MSRLFQTIKEEAIPDYNWEGYYWLSNKVTPQTINSVVPNDIFKTLPYVVEAYFYSREKNASISVKNIEGRNVITLFDMNAVQKSDYEKRERIYLAHRLDGVKGLRFCEIWKEETDNLCAGMKTLVPYCSVFIGFEK